MSTVVVAVTGEHPPDAKVVYVTVYEPAVLVDGVIAPVVAFSVSPPVELKVPPVYDPVPVRLTEISPASDLQYGPPAQLIDAVGKTVTVTVVVTGTDAHPPEAGIVYVIVQVLDELDDGVIAPDVPSIVSPPGLEVKVPPVYEPVPEIITGIFPATDVQNGSPA